MTITYLGRGPLRQATNDRGVRTYTESLLFTTSVSTENQWHVGSDTHVPVIGTVHPDDPIAYLQTITVDNTDPKFGWTVTLSYSTERALAEVPTSDPALITWGSEQFQKPVVFDSNEDIVCNSAGDPFDPPEMMDDSRRVCTVQKNLTFVPIWILDYQDAVNSDAFTVDGVSIAIGQAKMQNVTVSEWQIRGNTAYRTVTFSIHFQRDGWKLKPLDAGFRERVASGTPDGIVSIRNPDDGESVTAPVPLDGNGVALADPSVTNNVFLEFEVYKTREFASLPLT